MKTLWNKIVKKLTADPVEQYLNQSTDLADLEMRMQKLREKGIWL